MPHPRERKIPTPLFLWRTGGQMGAPRAHLPPGFRSRFVGWSPDTPGNLERGVAMATPPPPPPQGTWAPRVPAAAAERGGRGGRGIAQRWRSGPPLIPPSQTLIRLQMADGSPPFPHFPNKGREGAAHWTPVTLSQYQLEGTSVNLHRMWRLIFSPLTRAETEVQRGKGIGPRAG